MRFVKEDINIHGQISEQKVLKGARKIFIK
jgi:hypothetical protein